MKTLFILQFVPQYNALNGRMLKVQVQDSDTNTNEGPSQKVKQEEKFWARWFQPGKLSSGHKKIVIDHLFFNHVCKHCSHL